MKSRSVAPHHTGPEKVAYILPQGRLGPTKSRTSGRPVRERAHDASGYLLVGMYESLGKTFTTSKAAAAWATERGYKVKTSRPLRRQQAE